MAFNRSILRRIEPSFSLSVASCSAISLEKLGRAELLGSFTSLRAGRSASPAHDERCCATVSAANQPRSCLVAVGGGDGGDGECSTVVMVAVILGDDGVRLCKTCLRVTRGAASWSSSVVSSSVRRSDSYAAVLSSSWCSRVGGVRSDNALPKSRDILCMQTMIT